jgi:hypothetical protein
MPLLNTNRGRGMRGILGKIAFAAAVSAAAVQPAQACWNETGQDAVKITHLNTMLLVTALRCRGGADNFLPEYNRFVVNNSSISGNQGRVIKTHFAATHGAKGAEGALDRMSIGFANSYGTGHRQMNCKQLKMLAAGLASQKHGVATLAQAADSAIIPSSMPGGTCPSRMAARP